MNEISIADLKSRALKFPEPVRTLILSEPDHLEIRDYISKMQTWERLLRLKKEAP